MPENPAPWRESLQSPGSSDFVCFVGAFTVTVAITDFLTGTWQCVTVTRKKGQNLVIELGSAGLREWN